MSFGNLLQLIKNVIISPEVIIAAVLLVLYLKLVFYVVRYRKRSGPSLEATLKKNAKKTDAPSAEAGISE